jgi:hypothetical protein
MACPFFMPTEKLAGGSWPHPSRLPLGSGWTGHCTAVGHESACLTDVELESCNLGYAAKCHRLPQDRPWDSVRFGLIAPNQSPGRTISLRYVCERDHRPVEHGSLEFDSVALNCQHPHANAQLQKMAECFLQSCTDRITDRICAEKKQS